MGGEGAGRKGTRQVVSNEANHQQWFLQVSVVFCTFVNSRHVVSATSTRQTLQISFVQLQYHSGHAARERMARVDHANELDLQPDVQ